MKKSLILLVLLVAAFGLQAQKMVPVTLSWKFENVEEGYDHDNKCVVYVDGEETQTSSVTPQTKLNKMMIKVPAGKHDIQVISLAKYEGKWEEHTIDNDYSIDCVYDATIKAKKAVKIDIIFDLDEGVSGKVK